MAAAAWVLTLATAKPAAAGQDTPVRLIIPPGAPLPFSAGELQSAVQARLPVATSDETTATPVRVAPGLAVDAVSVSVADGRQDVWVAGKGAAEAARLVALAVVDLTRPPPAPALEAAAIGAAEGAVLRKPASPPLSPRTPMPRLTLGLFPGLSSGLGGGVAAFEPTLELTVARARSGTGAGVGESGWALALSAGYARTSAAWRTQEFRLTTLPVRLGARWTWRALEVTGGGAARVYDTGGLDGGRGALLGGFASVGASGPIGRGVRWAALAGCDLYQEKLVFRAAGTPVLSTGPLIIWLGVGARWGGGAS